MKIGHECGRSGGDDCSLSGCSGFKYDYEVFYSDGKHYMFAKLCDKALKRFQNYGWKTAYVKAGDIIKNDAAPKQDGLACISCRTWSQYSEPNQENGGFICFSCRKYPFYK